MTPLDTDVAVCITIILALIALVAQDLYWRRREGRAADAWAEHIDETVAEHKDARNVAITNAARSERRAYVAERTVTELTSELAKERRGAMILRTGILEAEREVLKITEAALIPARRMDGMS